MGRMPVPMTRMKRYLDPATREKILQKICKLLDIPDEGVWRIDASITGDTDQWVARVDYAAQLGGGYQLFEGDLFTGSIRKASPVMGKGRVTPKKPNLVPTQPVRTREEVLDELAKIDADLEYNPPLDEERHT